MVIIEICRQYHWDYYTYLAQPLWVIDLIVEKMKIDAKKQKARDEEIKRKK